MPDFPASSAAQDASTVLPTGLTQPKPVTTTRLRDIKGMLRKKYQKLNKKNNMQILLKKQ
jgi:hypothetical protein